jgi:hypothetical protein
MRFSMHFVAPGVNMMRSMLNCPDESERFFGLISGGGKPLRGPFPYEDAKHVELPG